MHWRRVGDRGCALSWVLGKRKRLALRIPGRAQRRPVWLFGGLAPTPFWLRLRRGGCGVAVAQVRGGFVI